MERLRKGNSPPLPSQMLGNKLVRFLFLQAPLYLTLTLWLIVHGVQRVYTGPLSRLVRSLEIPDVTDEQGLYLARDSEVTYYNRQCHLDDISTRDANDLLIRPEFSQAQRRHVMMTHGAVVMKNILTYETSARLRDYLERRHDTFMKNGMVLPWNELFWDGGNGSRLSLGIGPEDDPIIAQALHEVGHNKQLEETVTAIVGPNPALVEVSTLTTMHGAKNQGIHTDSDYFGSSVLYARTFLHSYTMFVALQDTTAKMGATTLCPGTHFCANDDLTEVCMAPTPDMQRNSFEASSNGQTGLDSGILLQGDAMMFNQNVWHRGPKNKDPDRPYNRAMFILTFISQRDFDKGDVRQQGWGTYYYMRHSMWGQAFNDLKNVLKGGMSLPVRFLKAYGLYSTSSSGNGRGMPWLEHWARQMANEMDFFTAGELQAFKDMLTSSRWFPRRLLGNPDSNDWDEYLLEIIQNAVDWIDGIFFRVLIMYLVGYIASYYLLFINFSPKHTSSEKKGGETTLSSNNWVGSLRFLFLLLLDHAVIVAIFLGLYHAVLPHTPLFRRISNGYIYRKPFPVLDDKSLRRHLKGRVTTIPDRMDILFGSRFDTPYLASMNEMLDYHPGNKEWHRLIRETAGFPLETVASQVLVDNVTSSTKPLQGVSRRFLLQDFATGYWIVMSKKEAENEALQALHLATHPPLRGIVSYWKEVLADARFGRQRDTAMAKTWTPKTVDDWINRVFTPTVSHSPHRRLSLSQANQKAGLLSVRSLTSENWVPSTSTFREYLVQKEKGIITLKVDDIVLIKGTSKEPAYLAKILQVLNPNEVHVRYVDSHETMTLSKDDIQPHIPITQGNSVMTPSVDGDDSDEEWISSRVVLMHPTGVADIVVGEPDIGKTGYGLDEIDSLGVADIYLQQEGQVPDFRLDWR